jgi:ATP-binding cassette subfamily A (ABC1) protein 3
MTGLLKPNCGTIELLGFNYQNNKEEIRKSIGLCLQFNVLYEFLTVEEHLKFYGLLKGIPPDELKQKVQEIISECSLEAEKGKFVKNLSGGNKRKLSLANALIGKSKIIFLDEPSSGLDPTSRSDIWNIIKSIRTPHRSLILTTHHLEEAEELSQTIGIMVEGKMVIIGTS